MKKFTPPKFTHDTDLLLTQLPFIDTKYMSNYYEGVFGYKPRVVNKCRVLTVEEAFKICNHHMDKYDSGKRHISFETYGKFKKLRHNLDVRLSDYLKVLSETN